MAIQFPSSPTLNQTYTHNSITWTYNGTAWTKSSGGGGGASTPSAVSDQANTSTGYFDLPSGTTAQRPGTTQNGMVRMNTTLGYPEWYSESYSSWFGFSSSGSYTIDYLVVAGGGGGGYDGAGGGGAGGLLTSTGYLIAPGTSITVTVGAGGAAAPNTTATGTRGTSGFNS